MKFAIYLKTSGIYICFPHKHDIFRFPHLCRRSLFQTKKQRNTIANLRFNFPVFRGLYGLSSARKFSAVTAFPASPRRNVPPRKQRRLLVTWHFSHFRLLLSVSLLLPVSVLSPSLSILLFSPFYQAFIRLLHKIAVGFYPAPQPPYSPLFIPYNAFPCVYF